MPHSSLTPSGVLKVSSYGSRGSISVEADGKRLCCSVVGDALGKCQFVVDTGKLISFLIDTRATSLLCLPTPENPGSLRSLS